MPTSRLLGLLRGSHLKLLMSDVSLLADRVTWKLAYMILPSSQFGVDT